MYSGRAMSFPACGGLPTMQKITTFLWFDNQAEEAVNQYISVFPDSKILKVQRTPGAEPGPVLVIQFQLAGQEYMALNGGPDHKFTEAISLSVDCADQDEVDRLWAQLSEGGEQGPCGWLKDRYGLSWQIVPRRLPELLADPDPGRSSRAMAAMMKMSKIDVKALEDAAAG
jgi:predicted 3-demethylubiquinone-9 3-methyltransferase (glyoxalase superfamily)